MKQLHIQNIVASDVQSGTVQIPGAAALAVAGLLNQQGGHLVEAWFEGRANAFNGGMNRIRNLAKGITPGQYDRIDIPNFPAEHQIETINGVPALRTRFARYDFMREGSTDWTLALVARLGDVASGNTSIFGGQVGSSGWVNIPALNSSSTGALRVYGSPGHTNLLLQASVAHLPDFKNRLYSIVVSQSVRNGVRIRVDGAQVAEATSTAARVQSSGQGVCFLCSDFSASAAWYGWVRGALLLNDDVTDDANALAAVEQYLASLTTP